MKTRWGGPAEALARFHDRVGAPTEDGCWPWLGRRETNGYGRLGVRFAHRIAVELAHGPIPAGLVVDHLCRNKLCVNPAHLEVVTQMENVHRGNAVGALTGLCGTGRHPKALNYRVKPNGKGYCRACNREHNAAYWRATVARRAAA